MFLDSLNEKMNVSLQYWKIWNIIQNLITIHISFFNISRLPSTSKKLIPFILERCTTSKIHWQRKTKFEHMWTLVPSIKGAHFNIKVSTLNFIVVNYFRNCCKQEQSCYKVKFWIEVNLATHEYSRYFKSEFACDMIFVNIFIVG